MAKNFMIVFHVKKYVFFFLLLLFAVCFSTDRNWIRRLCLFCAMKHLARASCLAHVSVALLLLSSSSSSLLFVVVCFDEFPGFFYAQIVLHSALVDTFFLLRLSLVSFQSLRLVSFRSHLDAIEWVRYMFGSCKTPKQQLNVHFYAFAENRSAMSDWRIERATKTQKKNNNVDEISNARDNGW